MGYPLLRINCGTDERDWRHRARRVLNNWIPFDVVGDGEPPAAWLHLEDTFPEQEKEAEFQVWWRDENRAAVGSRE